MLELTDTNVYRMYKIRPKKPLKTSCRSSSTTVVRTGDYVPVIAAAMLDKIPKAGHSPVKERDERGTRAKCWEQFHSVCSRMHKAEYMCLRREETSAEQSANHRFANPKVLT